MSLVASRVNVPVCARFSLCRSFFVTCGRQQVLPVAGTSRVWVCVCPGGPCARAPGRLVGLCASERIQGLFAGSVGVAGGAGGGRCARREASWGVEGFPLCSAACLGAVCACWLVVGAQVRASLSGVGARGAAGPVGVCWCVRQVTGGSPHPLASRVWCRGLRLGLRAWTRHSASAQDFAYRRAFGPRHCASMMPDEKMSGACV